MFAPLSTADSPLPIDWLTANNAAVLAVLFVVFGLALARDRIQILG